MIKNIVLGLGLAGLVSCRSSCAPDFNYPPKNEQLHLCGRLTLTNATVRPFLNGWTPMYELDAIVELGCYTSDFLKLDPKYHGEEGNYNQVRLKLRGIGTETYLKELEKWDKSERDLAEKIPKKLAVSPYTGDHCGYPFLREKRIREKRIYYLIYDDIKLVLLVATSGKKDQQVTINHIKEHLDQFRKIAEEKFRQVS